ncbi:hypothetical protein D3C83_142620 [compost metagenome]
MPDIFQTVLAGGVQRKRGTLAKCTVKNQLPGVPCLQTDQLSVLRKRRLQQLVGNMD